MILAAIEGNLLVLLLMAVFGFISWLSGKLNPGDKKPSSQGPAPRPVTPQRRGAESSEEERMRRFFEALGVPVEERPALPSQPVKQQPAPPPLPARPKQAPRPVPAPPPMVRSLDELETTSFPVEQIVLAELTTSKISEFETVSSRISAGHERTAPAREPAAQPPSMPIHALLRAALASPQQLRTAFVLREILGPPPGLRD